MVRGHGANLPCHDRALPFTNEHAGACRKGAGRRQALTTRGRSGPRARVSRGLSPVPLIPLIPLIPLTSHLSRESHINFSCLVSRRVPSPGARCACSGPALQSVRPTRPSGPSDRPNDGTVGPCRRRSRRRGGAGALAPVGTSLTHRRLRRRREPCGVRDARRVACKWRPATAPVGDTPDAWAGVRQSPRLLLGRARSSRARGRARGREHRTRD